MLGRMIERIKMPILNEIEFGINKVFETRSIDKEESMSENRSENMVQLEIPQDWGMYMQGLDEKPALTRVNLALDEFAPVEDYKYRIQFAVYFQEPLENGLPNSEENPILWEIEDLIFEEIQKLDVIDAGLMKWNGRTNFFLYAKSEDGIKEAFVNALQSKFADYRWDFWVDEDSEWDGYFETLYPSPYSMQEIQNNRVIHALEEAGDDLDVERAIEHWAYFKTKEGADAFIEKTEEMGFELFMDELLEHEETKDEVEDKEEYPYQVRVSNLLSPLDVHETTWDLMDLAEEFDGYYDGWECAVVKE